MNKYSPSDRTRMQVYIVAFPLETDKLPHNRRSHGCNTRTQSGFPSWFSPGKVN
jgi:hypothetical protein